MPKSVSGDLLIKRLKELRKRHLLTQEKFSEISGVAYKYYQLIEIGKRIDLRLSTLEKLASAYGIGVHELLSPTMPKGRVSFGGGSKIRRKKTVPAKTKQTVK